MFCVTSNCGNANLLGAKLVRRGVDHQQGSTGVCCNNGGLYSNCEDSGKQGPGSEADPPPVAFFSSVTEPVLWMVQPPNLLNFERLTAEQRRELKVSCMWSLTSVAVIVLTFDSDRHV